MWLVWEGSPSPIGMEMKSAQFQQVSGWPLGNKRREASCLFYPILSLYTHWICIILRNSCGKTGLDMFTSVLLMVAPLQLPQGIDPPKTFLKSIPVPSAIVPLYSMDSIIINKPSCFNVFDIYLFVRCFMIIVFYRHLND